LGGIGTAYSAVLARFKRTPLTVRIDADHAAGSKKRKRRFRLMEMKGSATS